VDALESVAVTPGITAPVESVTTPLIEELSWAMAGKVVERTTINNSNLRSCISMDLLLLECVGPNTGLLDDELQNGHRAGQCDRTPGTGDKKVGCHEERPHGRREFFLFAPRRGRRFLLIGMKPNNAL
jgi:hypothetical protein